MGDRSVNRYIKAYVVESSNQAKGKNSWLWLYSKVKKGYESGLKDYKCPASVDLNLGLIIILITDNKIDNW